MTVNLKKINVQSQETFAGVGETSDDSLYFVESVVVINTFHNGADWSRTYSDGWCEQGGQTNIVQPGAEVTIPLHVILKDTNYIVVLTAFGNYNTNNSKTTTVISKSTGNFHFINGSAGEQSFMWEAKGYIS